MSLLGFVSAQSPLFSSGAVFSANTNRRGFLYPSARSFSTCVK